LIFYHILFPEYEVQQTNINQQEPTQNFQPRLSIFELPSIRGHRRHSTEQATRSSAQQLRIVRSMSLPTYNEASESNLPTYDEALNNNDPKIDDGRLKEL